MVVLLRSARPDSSQWLLNTFWIALQKLGRPSALGHFNVLAGKTSGEAEKTRLAASTQQKPNAMVTPGSERDPNSLQFHTPREEDRGIQAGEYFEGEADMEMELREGQFQPR